MSRSLVLSLCLLANSVSYADTISLRADPYCPYNCEPGSSKLGFMIDIAKAVFEPRGHKVDYQSLNWARAIVESRTGKYTGIVGGLKENAPDFHYPDVSIGSSKSCFFASPKSTWTYKGVDSIASIKLGIVKDYSFGHTIDPYIEANGKNPKRIDYVSGNDAFELNINKLIKGRIDAILDDSSVVYDYLGSKGLKDQIKEVGCDDAKEIYIAFSPKLPGDKGKEYARILTEGMAELRKSGELSKIMARYGLKDWK